jgi:hypothetical protein
MTENCALCQYIRNCEHDARLRESIGRDNANMARSSADDGSNETLSIAGLSGQESFADVEDSMTREPVDGTIFTSGKAPPQR